MATSPSASGQKSQPATAHRPSKWTSHTLNLDALAKTMRGGSRLWSRHWPIREATTVTSPSDGRASSASCTASPVASALIRSVVQASPFSSVPKLSVNVPQTGWTPSTWPLASPAHAVSVPVVAGWVKLRASTSPWSAVNSM